ncbi:hypothetical protein [Chengkuizengella sediminis]|nr:hypothetical protein [Chengkuizengella sediminis]
MSMFTQLMDVLVPELSYEVTVYDWPHGSGVILIDHHCNFIH